MWNHSDTKSAWDDDLRDLCTDVDRLRCSAIRPEADGEKSSAAHQADER